MPQLNTTRRVWIYLPPDYYTSGKKYPVMYLQDGQNLFDAKTSYSGEWEIDETMNQIYSETGQSVVIVGVDHGGDERINELSPYKNEKYGGGKGDQYIEFIVKTLKPYIDNHYSTKADRKNTLIGGSSLGGLISVYGAVKYPQIFGDILAFSPAFWFNSKDINAFIENSDSNLKKQKIYIVQGRNEDEDMEEQTTRVINNLKSKNLKSKNIFFKIDEDGKHNEAYWGREFKGAFLWFLRKR